MRHLALTLRSLTRQPAVTVPVVLTLALGIGANTALFANFIQIFWPTLDSPHSERVVWVYDGTPEAPRQQISYPEYLDLRQRQTAVTDLTAYGVLGLSVGAGEQTTFAQAAVVSRGYFSFFGVRPVLGRLLQPADERPDAPPVAVVVQRFWRTLGGDSDSMGRLLRVIRINGQSVTVVGVVQESFSGPGLSPEIYVPVSQMDRLAGTPRLASRDVRSVTLFGRLSPGVSPQQANTALAGLAHALDESNPLTDSKRHITVVRRTGLDLDPEGQRDNSYFAASRILMAAALLFLLLGCASVANLLLARAAARQREWGIRAALGAGRLRLAGGVLLESLLLSLAGAAAGLPMARLLTHRFGAQLGLGTAGFGDPPAGHELVPLDGRAFAFALAAALFCTLLGGLGPVLRLTRRDLLDPLKSGAAGSGTSGRALAVRRVLVVAQVALSVLLLLGGGLLVRSLSHAADTDPGFPTDHLLLSTVYVPRQVAEGKRLEEIYGQAVDAVRAVPGVSAASMVQIAPLSGYLRAAKAAARERPDAKIPIAYNQVGPGYFATMGIPILAGRAVDERDRRDAAPAVVVSQALARRFWGTDSAVGRTLEMTEPPHAGDAGPVFTVVGVARDVRIKSLVDAPEPVVYFAYAQRLHPRMTMLARTAVSPLTLGPQLRKALRSVSPDLAVVDLMTCTEQIERGLLLPQMYAEVAALFGLLGLVVAVAGLFGLLSYSVSLRAREMGIRMAVGARPEDVRRLIVRQGMVLVIAGVALGVVTALPLSRVLASLLFGIEPLDPFTFAAVPVLLLLVSLLACLLPARRAGRLDPSAMLRSL
jgi:predicted permease